MLKNKKAAGSFQTASQYTHLYCNKNNKIIKPFPPYGRKLFDARQHGYKPKNDVFLFIGKNAWQKAKDFTNWQDVLALPPNCEPDKFNWSVVNESSVLVFDTGNVNYTVIRKLAYILLLASASIVRVALPANLIIFHKGETGYGQPKIQR
ncbi:MAG: hypothetical protein PVI75_00250 [Gammaproteobacteria bacterium]|jgi:hypothetical protein